MIILYKIKIIYKNLKIKTKKKTSFFFTSFFILSLLLLLRVFFLHSSSSTLRPSFSSSSSFFFLLILLRLLLLFSIVFSFVSFSFFLPCTTAGVIYYCLQSATTKQCMLRDLQPLEATWNRRCHRLKLLPSALPL